MCKMESVGESVLTGTPTQNVKVVSDGASGKKSAEYVKHTAFHLVLAISNRSLCERPFLEQIERVCKLRPDALVLREKDLSPQEYKELAEQVLEMDGGGSHLPAEIPQFLDRLEEGYDCVWGSRFMEGGSMREQPLYRRILSFGGTFLSNLVLGTRLRDMTSGFEAFQREVLEKLELSHFLSTGHMYQTEMRFYCRNLNTVEVPIHYVGTASSLKGSSVTEALRLLFQLKENEGMIWKK